GVVGRRQVAGEQGRFAQALEHLIAIAPDAQAEQTGRLAQAVADSSIRLDSEGPQQVRDQRAVRHLGEKDTARMHVVYWQAAPKPIRRILAAQEAIFTLLAVEDPREEKSQFATHVWILIARAGENKGDLAALVQIGNAGQNARNRRWVSGKQRFQRRNRIG